MLDKYDFPQAYLALDSQYFTFDLKTMILKCVFLIQLCNLFNFYIYINKETIGLPFFNNFVSYLGTDSNSCVNIVMY